MSYPEVGKREGRVDGDLRRRMRTHRGVRNAHLHPVFVDAALSQSRDPTGVRYGRVFVGGRCGCGGGA